MSVERMIPLTPVKCGRKIITPANKNITKTTYGLTKKSMIGCCQNDESALKENNVIVMIPAIAEFGK